MPKLELALLGRPEARLGGRPVAFRTRKTLALLAYLALEPGSHPRERVAALLWPDSDPERARAALRTTLAYLREALGDAAGLLDARRDRVGLAVGGGDLAVDALELEQAAGPGPVDRQRLDLAAAACRGELLAEVELPDAPEFGDWLAGRRAGCREVLERGLERLSAAQAGSGEPEAALMTAARWARLEPFSEPARRRLMSARAALGDRARAVEDFEGFRALLEGELGVTPSPETAGLAARLRAPAPAAIERPAAPAPASGEGHALESPARAAPPGRELEWARLEAAWAAGDLMAVSGEPGAGKSRLLRDFLSGRAGAALVAARPGDAGAPFALAVRALRAALDPAVLPAWARRELARVLPELDDGPAPPAGSDDGRARLIEALVLGLTAGGRLGMVVDDAQFLDQASLELVAYLAGREPAGPVVLAFRRNELPEALAEVVRRRLETGRAVRIELAGLDAVGLQALVRETRPDLLEGEAAALAAALVPVTGGNPLFALELTRALAGRGGAPGRLPATPRVEAVIRHRLERLSPDALRLARLAAVAGEDFDLALAGVALSQGPAALSEPLGMLESAGLLRGSRLAHDLIVEVTLRHAPDVVRQALHAAVLAALEPRGTAPAVLARYALAAGLPESILRHSRAAGDAARAVWALPEAAGHYLAARHALAELRDAGRASFGASEELRLLEGLAGVLYDARDPGATGALEELLAFARASAEPEVACRALAWLSYLAQLDGNLELSAARCQEALEVAESSGDAIAELEARVAAYWHAFAARDLPGQAEQLERALAIARPLGDQGRLASLLRLSAQEALRRGQLDESIRLALEARAMFLELGDRDNESEALSWASWSTILAGRPRDGLRLAREGLAVADAAGHPLRRAENQQLTALASLETGALGTAAEAAERALAITRLDERHLRHQRGLVIAACVAYALGNLEAALGHALDCERVAPATSWLSGMTNVLRCAISRGQGDLEAARAVARAAASAAAPFFPVHLVPTWVQVEALLEAGEPELARASVARLEVHAGSPRVRIAFLRSRAVLERACGDLDEALASLVQALALAADIGLPLERWGIEADTARLLAARGDLAGASQARARARVVVERLALSIEGAAARERFTAWAAGPS